MPWKECSVMDERLRFVSRLLDGETMAEAILEHFQQPRNRALIEKLSGLGVSP